MREPERKCPQCGLVSHVWEAVFNKKTLYKERAVYGITTDYDVKCQRCGKRNPYRGFIVDDIWDEMCTPRMAPSDNYIRYTGVCRNP
jgi:hypothetical protein